MSKKSTKIPQTKQLFSKAQSNEPKAVPSFDYQPNELKALDFNKIFNEKQKSKQKELFVYFDKMKTGFVNKEDLPYMLRAFGLLVSIYDVHELVEQMDSEKKGKINFRQFQTTTYVFKSKLPQKEEIENSLKIFDKLNNGQIDLNEFKSILMNMGDVVTKKEFDIIIKDLTIVNGFVSYKDLVNVLMSVPK